MSDEVTKNYDRFEAAVDEDYLLSHTKLTTRAVSSIPCDSDLRRVGALPIKEALALLIQGTASLRLSAFVNLLLYCFSSII